MLSLTGFNAQAFSLVASAATAADNTPAAKSREMVVITGKITNPAGVLPGAVIIVKSTRQMAVTNAEGEFQLTVPASVGLLQAVVTYAGYADEPLTLSTSTAESTMNLSNAVVVSVARGQRLKVYLKTARKEVKRSLRQVRQ